MVFPRKSTVRLVAARLVTEDVARLTRFYHELGGSVPMGNEQHYVEIEFGPAALAIVSKRGVDLFNAAAAEPGANRSVILDFEVEDVDAERRRLAELIGVPVMEPTDQPWGNRAMLFRDPDGNLINFYTATGGGCGCLS